MQSPKESVPEWSPNSHAGLSHREGGKPFLQRSEVTEMPSETVRHAEWPGTASGPARENVTLAEGLSPGAPTVWATLRSPDLTLKGGVLNRRSMYRDQRPWMENRYEDRDWRREEG